MASPFRTFRKYQKTMLVVAGVVLMFVFVIGDPLSQYLRGSAQGRGGARHPKEVAVKWNGGQLTNEELGHLVMRRLILNNFIRNVVVFGQQAAEEAGGEPAPLRVVPIIGAERPEQGVEQDVLRTRLFADAARHAGMAISDEYLVNYLMQLGRGYVSPDAIRRIIAASDNRGRGASIDYILEALREEMLARNFLTSYMYAFQTELPEDRWRDWLRVNDRVVVEAVPITSESLLPDVKEPTEAELAAFFNEFKDREPMPDRDWGIELPSPDPAFKIPQKVATQYVMADFNQFLTKVEDEVTDAEIEEFYEKNKDPYFIRAESVLSEPGDLMEQSPAEKPSAESTPPAETPAATPPADPSKAKPDTNEGSSRSVENPFRLVAFQDTAAPADKPAEAPADANKTAAESPAATPTQSEPSAAPAAAATTEAPAEKPKVFQPLDEVRDQIRREIAGAKVAEQLDKLMTDVEHELNDSYTEFFGASLDAEGAGKAPPAPPAPLADLTQIAQKNKLVYQKTEPASMLELRDTPVGASVRRDQGNAPFYYAVFQRDVELYQPISTYDLDNNRYVAMKTQDMPGKVPTLDEVREEVVRAWKMREAGKLALKRAEQLAKQAQEKSGSLTDAIAGDESLKIIKTDPFAFFTIGSVSRDTQQVESFRLSEPDGLIAAGPEFMEKVFALKEGEVAAAPNHDDTVAYVAKVAQHQNSLAELRQAFLAEDNNWYGVPAMARGHFISTRSNVVAEMFKSADVDWVRDPDKVIRSEDQSDESSEDAPAEETPADKT